MHITSLCNVLQNTRLLILSVSKSGEIYPVKKAASNYKIARIL